MSLEGQDVSIIDQSLLLSSSERLRAGGGRGKREKGEKGGGGGFWVAVSRTKHLGEIVRMENG